MASAINVSVDDALKKEVTDLYADLGMTVQEAIRIFYVVQSECKECHFLCVN